MGGSFTYCSHRKESSEFTHAFLSEMSQNRVNTAKSTGTNWRYGSITKKSEVPDDIQNGFVPAMFTFAMISYKSTRMHTITRRHPTCGDSKLKSRRRFTLIWKLDKGIAQYTRSASHESVNCFSYCRF